MTFRPLKKEVNLKFNEIKKTSIFYFYIGRLRLLNYFRFRFLRYVNSKKTIIGTLVYFLILIGTILFLGKFIDPSFNKSDAITFFTAVAAMIGGILAIIFSLSILLMGNAAERIPVGFYETAAKDRFHGLIFFFISICSLTIFTFALLFGKLGLGFSVISFQAVLFLVGGVFYLTFIFYQRVRSRLNPVNVLKIASKQAFDQLESTHKRAQEIAEVLIRQPKLDKTVTKEQILATSFQYLRPEFAYINNRLNYLFDYHNKLVASNERSSALGVLQIITQILQKYFQTRKDSSLVLPAGFILATTSDSREFLTPPLEKLVAVGENYMRDNDNEGITRVISIFVELCKSASQINYLTKHKAESPIMEQCMGYLNYLLQSAIKFNHQEALFQGAVVYPQITPIIIKQNLHHKFLSIYEMLDKIAVSALANRFNVVFGEVINAYATIISQLILSRYFNLKMELKILLEHLRDIIFYAYASMSVGALESSFVTQTNLALPFKTLSSLIFQAAKAATDTKTQDEQKDWKQIFFTSVEELRATFRYLSEKMKTPNHILVNTFGGAISDIGCLILDLTQNNKWKEDKTELTKQVGWYLYQTEWFIHEAEKIKDNYAFDSLVEAAAKIGIRALQRDQDETAKDAIKIISNFANKMLVKEEGNVYGFTEPRIMERACFIGILALKLGKKEIINELKKYIKPFEEAYIKKWFSNLPKGVKLSSPTKDQLMMEVHGLIQEIRNRYGNLPVMDSSNEIMTQLVNEEDVDKFIFEVWRVKIRS
ncbi:MAG: hypothetical protein HQ569_01265 [Actinobacteria bacterium]|nr:hypothetical protein [Actinomycetota bacterium]